MNRDTMTTKERMRAALAGQAVDRLPFWPKLFGAYQQARLAPFSDMSIRDLHRWIGSDQHDFSPLCTRERHHTSSSKVETTCNERSTIYHTPHGDTALRESWDAASQSWHPIAHPIHDLHTLQLMIKYYSDLSYEYDAEKHEAACARQRELGEDSFTGATIGESPLMHFIEYLAGVETAHLLLADYPQEVEALFSAMHAGLLHRSELEAAYSPADTLYFCENTSTTLISPAQFRQYCLPHLRDYGSIAHAANRTMTLHMCGHLKALLPDLATLPVDAFEAFTSPTLGNTTLLDGRTACPQTCLIGGTNAMLWLRTAQEIIAQLDADLSVLPHHRALVITSAGVMPPMTAPETIQTVCEWVQHYHAVM